MPFVWIGIVSSPKEVCEKQSFNIIVRRWFLTWPFSEVTLFTNIYDDKGEEWKQKTTFIPRWFWGYHHLNVVTKIIDDTEYDIEVGYES